MNSVYVWNIEKEVGYGVGKGRFIFFLKFRNFSVCVCVSSYIFQIVILGARRP